MKVLIIIHHLLKKRKEKKKRQLGPYHPFVAEDRREKWMTSSTLAQL